MCLNFFQVVENYILAKIPVIIKIQQNVNVHIVKCLVLYDFIYFKIYLYLFEHNFRTFLVILIKSMKPETDLDLD